MQKTKIKNLTIGAMLLAIYAALMMINNVIGHFLSDVIPVILTASILIYSQRTKVWPLIIGIIIITILFGDVTTYVYSTLFAIGATITSILFKRKLVGNNAALILLIQFFICEILGGILILPLLGVSINERIVVLMNTLPSFLGTKTIFMIVIINYFLLSLIYSLVDSFITMKLVVKLNSTFKYS